MASIAEPETQDRLVPASAFVLCVGLAAIAAALAFEHIGGYKPCPLCLQQRIAYYVAIPAALAAIVLARPGRGMLIRGLVTLCGLAFLVNAGLGAYHSGVEWQWWPGPASCAGDVTGLATANLLGALQQTEVIRCDEAPWRLFGLSFAGYNAVISAGLAVVALSAALNPKAPRTA